MNLIIDITLWAIVAVLAVGRLAEERAQLRPKLRAQVFRALDRFCSRDTRVACRRAFRRRDAKEQQP